MKPIIFDSAELLTVCVETGETIIDKEKLNRLLEDVYNGGFEDGKRAGNVVNWMPSVPGYQVPGDIMCKHRNELVKEGLLISESMNEPVKNIREDRWK